MISVRWWNANAYYAVSLAEALQKAGRTATVCGRSTSPALRKAIEKNLDHIDTVNFESGNLLQLISSLGKLIKHIRKQKFNILAAHRSQDVLFAYLAKKQTRQSVKLIRCVSDVRPPKNNIFNRYIHEKEVDHLVFSCKVLRRKYIDVWPFVAEKSSVIYSAVDTNYFRPDHPGGLRKKLNIPEESIVISMIARLSPVKDHPTFIAAAADIFAKRPDCIFVVSGKEFEVEMDSLKVETERYGLTNNFRFLDKVDDVRDLISLTDIGVIPSKGSEVVCRIALEFMAMGKPLVVSNINILPEIVKDCANGYVFSAQDAQSLAGKLMLLVTDKESRILFGNRARILCEENYSFPVLVRDMEDIYMNVLHSQQSEA